MTAPTAFRGRLNQRRTCEAIQFVDNVSAIAIHDWCGARPQIDPSDGVAKVLMLDTAAGTVQVRLGDWVVRVPSQGFQQFSAVTFAQRYREAP